MTRKMILPLLFGIVGTAILLWLGSWQVARLTWKQAVLSDISARIAASPVALPENPDPVTHRFLPVTATGIIDDGVQVFTSVKGHGAGYRMLSVFTVQGAGNTRRLLLDRGFRPVTSQADFNGASEVTVIGNLHWPQEVDGFTPAPEITSGIATWYARDIPAIAERLGTEPVLIVARRLSPDTLIARPLPLGTTGIANNHLGYAITWFSLAFVWLVMTVAVLWRIRHRTR